MAAPSKTWTIDARDFKLLPQLGRIWKSRYLLLYFGKSFIRKIYNRTLLGWIWFPLRLLVPIFLGSFIFGDLLGIGSEGIPYFLFFLVGMTSWRLFLMSWRFTTRSLYANRRVFRVAPTFPLIMLVIASVAPAIVELLILVPLILGTVLSYWMITGSFYLQLGWNLLVTLVAGFLILVLSISLGLWTSVLMLRSKDIWYAQRFIIRLWFFLTPVFYSLSTVPKEWHHILLLNPMTTMIGAFKWGLLGIGEFSLAYSLYAIGILLLILSSGLWYFHRISGTLIEIGGKFDEVDDSDSIDDEEAF